MPRPRKSTLDAWVDTLLAWDRSDREGALEVAQIAHRAASQTEDRIARRDSGPQQIPLDKCTVQRTGHHYDQ